MLNNLAAKHQDKPVIMISPFYCDNYLLCEGIRSKKWREIMEERIRKADLPNVTYVNGLDILNKSEYLTADLVHPNVDGVQKIADDLYPIITAAIIKCE